MPQFVDRNSVKQVDLGPCQCPDKTRHQTDSVWLVERLSYPDQLHLADAMAVSNVEALWTLFNLRVKRWNLVDAKGKAVPLSRAVWQNLDEDFAKPIQDAIGDLQQDDEPAVPND